MPSYDIAESIRFDTELYTLTKGELSVRLSRKETEVLAVLCIHSDTTVTRQFLFDNAWPNGTGSDGHLNRVILLLRRKFDSLGALDAIKTIPKVGYILNNAVRLTDEEDAHSKSLTTPQQIDNDEQLNQLDINSDTWGHPETPKDEILSHARRPYLLARPNINRTSWVAVILTTVAVLTTVGFGILTTLDQFTTHDDPTELKNAPDEVYSTLIKNISLSSSLPLDSELITDTKKLLSDWDNDPVIPPFLGAFKSRGHAACARRCFGV